MFAEPLQHPQIDPVMFSIGPFDLHWYGLMYLIGAMFAYWWGGQRAHADLYWQKEQWQDLLFWGFLALILAGRIGYVLFYQFETLIQNPLYRSNLMSGGMLILGGRLGVILLLAIFAKKRD